MERLGALFRVGAGILSSNTLKPMMSLFGEPTLASLKLALSFTA
jgi:hypothetical protein